jgi:Mrp family chromosome partitioning ATPase
MDPVEYLRGIKRRWRLVAAMVALALAGGLVLSSIIGTGGSTTSKATVSLLQTQATTTTEPTRNNGSGSSSSSNLGAIAALISVDQITQKVAKEMSFAGDPHRLAKKVTAFVDPKTGFLKITASADSPERARQLADSFARHLMAFLVEREATSNAILAKTLQDQITRIRNDIKALDKQIAKYPSAVAAINAGGPSRSGSSSGTGKTPANTGTPADPLIAQRNSAIELIESLSKQLQEVKARTADAEGLSIIQAATPEKGNPGLSLPSSTIARLLIAGILGLLGGVTLALIRERFDRRIRTKESAERHFGFPVLAEVPAVRRRGILPWRRTPPTAMISTLPPAVVDAYRIVASSLGTASRTNGNVPSHDTRGRPTAILVTSPGPKDARGATVAQLAATLATTGKTVTVVSCDFRHPEIGREFGVTDQRSLVEALSSSNGGPLLSTCLWQSPVNGVWVVPGGIAERSDQLLSSPALRRLLMEARQLSDVVLVDTAPILTSDATFLLPEVDAVLVAVRSGSTKPELAERSSEFLRRLKAPVAGVVLTGHTEAALPHGYYRTWSARRVVLGAPKAALTGWGRILRAAGRGVGKVVRRPKQAVSTTIDLTTTPESMTTTPEAVGAKTGNGAASDDDRGFPRLTRPSDGR